MPTQPAPEPNFMERLLKPLFDRLGLNGAAPLQATQRKESQPIDKPIDVKKLKAQGWSDDDIRYLQQIQRVHQLTK